MKLLIDTVNEDLYMAIINDEKTLSYAHLVKYKKKSDILPVVFKKLIDKLKINSNSIDEVYVVNGPGSFMGIRAGLVFAKTFTLIAKKKLFEIDNLSFISNGKDGTYYVDAKGKKSYRGIIKNRETQIDLINYEENSKIDYVNLISKPMGYLNLFKEIKDIVNLEEKYIKEPKIGGN